VGDRFAGLSSFGRRVWRQCAADFPANPSDRSMRIRTRQFRWNPRKRQGLHVSRQKPATIRSGATWAGLAVVTSSSRVGRPPGAGSRHQRLL